VYLQFIVNTDGTISDIEVLREQNEWLVKEAKRVVKNMPKWKPGRQGGRKVRVIFTLPIHFALK
jgi:protein TonB